MQNTRRIAIIGAGIAGLSMAIFATQQGFDVEVFEKSSEISQIGAGVTLWPNAMFVLDKMKLTKAISEIGVQPCGVQQMNQQGQVLSKLDLSQLSQECGYPSISILRKDLMLCLYEQVMQLNILCHFNSPVDSQDIGKLSSQFDLVVGADGRMHSQVRAAIFQTPIEPIYQGFINLIGTSPTPASVKSNPIQEFRENGVRFGIVPATAGSCYWAAAWACDINKNYTTQQWFKEAQSQFKHWPKAISTILHTANMHSCNHIFVHDLEPLPYWHQNNVVLIGDAAHASLPTSGQGASQALEDVWHLTHLLNQHEAIPDALNHFYQTRINKTTTAQTIGRHLAKQFFSDIPQQPVKMTPEKLRMLWMQGLTAPNLLS
ncbi:FAD-dependent monooxygenase [Pseudoalteromonas luteoviolacea]|uniref:FAD-dependent oxidoreductase n=1 Tax=Pseudoalteromonas luteoviolacea TaxID=43657 RepID=UPI001EEDF730|nr:FAD-dependent oxidoreductase [Pseudoalteromonas luteoviolacea]MCF6441813.1 FAD-dependent monooxygenase [Pseudoalteromonas luteoviolacea]